MMNVMEKAVEVEKVPSLSEMEEGLLCEFRQAFDMHSPAKHIHGKEAKGLCGSESLYYGKKTVTVEGLMLSLKHQNPSWFWCVDCAAAFTGKDKEFFLNSRTRSRS